LSEVAEGEGDLLEVICVFQFSEHAEIEIGRDIESLHATIVKLEVEREIFVCLCVITLFMFAPTSAARS